jgi:hypothetical protein
MSTFRSLTLLALSVAPAAAAYRPFDNTDAGVAGLREVELEIGPIGFVDAGGALQYAPRFVANYGIATETEVVFEGVDHHAVGRATGPRFSVSGLQLSLKHVFRQGVVQQSAGPSVAAECGALLPGYHDDEGFGALCTGIVSFAAGSVLLHLNATLALERTGNFAVEPALIAEGPQTWPVRPVAEALWSHEWGAGNAATLLAGLIWQLREDFSLDAALRRGRSEGANLTEARAGFTWAF